MVLYGHYQGYMSLPRNSSFCVNTTPVETIFYSTDSFGGRILSSNHSQQPKTVIFGESQALAMDSNSAPSIYVQLGIEEAIIYAAPNNGPYESYRRIFQGHYQKSEKNLMVINLGFDLFRLGSDWNPKQFNSTPLEQSEELISSPRLTSILNIWRGLNGEAVGFSGDDRDRKLMLFKANKQGIFQNLRIYLKEFHSLKLPRLGQLRTLFLAPYWMSDPLEIHQLKNIISSGLCTTENQAQEWLFAEISYSPSHMTKDQRHFNREAIFNLTKLKAYCE